MKSVARDADALIVGFDVPEALRDTFAFTQGQYLTLRTEVDGEDLRRSYSICSGLDDGTLRVGIRLLPGGVFSGWAAEHLQPGRHAATCCRRRAASTCRSIRTRTATCC